MATDARINITAVDRTRAAFSSIQNSLKSVTGAIFSVQGAVAGLAGAAGFGALIRSSLKTGDELGKTADKLGVTTEALAGLRHAAEQTAGVTGRTLDTALQRMTRRVSEASLGTGTAVKALDELNLSARELNSLSPDQQFRQIADAMQNVSNQGDRVRLSMQLFDTEGVALVNTLAEGSAALDEFADEAVQLGIALSRVDARRIEMANDAIDKVAKATQGAANAVTVELAPALTVLAEDYLTLSRDTEFWANLTSQAVSTVAVGLARVAELVNLLAGAWNGLKLITGEVFASVLRGIGSWAQTLADFTGSLPGVASQLTSTYQTIADFANNVAQSTEDTALKTEEAVLKNAENIGIYSQAAVDYLQRIQDKSREATESLITDNELQLESQENTVNRMAELLQRGAQEQEDAERVRKEIDRERARLTREANRREADEAAAKRKADQEKLQSGLAYLGAAKNITNALFQDSKAAQIASIVVDTAGAIMKTMSSLPFPANVAAAAGVAAMGVAQLATARGASKGGGGGSGPSTGFAPGGTPGTVPDPTLADQGPGGPGRRININLTGGLYSREDIRELIEGINREVGDGARLVTA